MRLLELISQRLGIQVRDQDTERLLRTLTDRSDELSFSGLDRYVQFLQTTGPHSDGEWEYLATLLTTCETFFFRGKAHSELLRTELLPALIQARDKDRSLRIWSAGCASGEEAYSIAIMLDELLGSRNDWNISQLGTDINVDMLNKARRGVFTDWSFRQVDPQIQKRYFHKNGSDWELDQRIKDMVTFRPLNLLTEPFPNMVAREMDLIICRNVFIYFSQEHVKSIVNKFAQTLRDGGYLLTGHGELQGQTAGQLVTRTFSNSLVLQRIDSQPQTGRSDTPLVTIAGSTSRPQRTSFPTGSSEPLATIAQRSPNRESATVKSVDTVEQLEQLLKLGQHTVALEKAARMAAENPRDVKVCCLLARGYADLGNHPKAIEWCSKAMAIDSFAVEPQYLLANIAETEGRYEEAKSYCRKVIYLDPSHVGAQLAFAALLEREGDRQQARKTRVAVIDFLKSKPNQAQIEHDGMTDGQLVSQIEQAATNG